jgi:transcriptional regulator with XRE-family HTH domain
MIVYSDTLRKVITSRGWTLIAVAEQAHVSYSWLRALCSGSRDTCSDVTVQALATVLGVHPDLIAIDIRKTDRVERRTRVKSTQS